ncbi:hypothetical protein BT67DRAFT_376521, partial [Trichocladium antarcticum]
RGHISARHPPRAAPNQPESDHDQVAASGAHESTALLGTSRRDTVIVDIASLLKGPDSNESSVSPTQQPTPTSAHPSAAVTLPSGGPPRASFAVAAGPLSPRLGGVGGVRARGHSVSAAAAGSGQAPSSRTASRPGSGGGGKRSMPSHTSESPAKKQSKWSPEEDALIIELRGSGMKWDDISKRLPGRSSISCRLHYQNYLERRSEWDEERKNKLARLYERFKPEMWAKVAEEMQVPWRAAEAMHWQLGEMDMARRAGVVPFSLNIAANEPQGLQRLSSPSRGGGHAHSQSQGSLPRDIAGLPSPRYTHHGIPMPSLIGAPTSVIVGGGGGRPLSSRRESFPSRPPSFPSPSDHHHHRHYHHQQQPDYAYAYGPPPSLGLAPIQSNPTTTAPSASLGPTPRGSMLPSVAELTTGISPYNTPAYSVVGGSSSIPTMASPPTPHQQHRHQQQQQQQLLPALAPYTNNPAPPPPPPPGPDGAGTAKRRASPPDAGAFRETSRRRHLHPQSAHPRSSGGPEEEDTAAAAAAAAAGGGEYPRGGGGYGTAAGGGGGVGVPTRRGPRGGGHGS